MGKGFFSRAIALAGIFLFYIMFAGCAGSISRTGNLSQVWHRTNYDPTWGVLVTEGQCNLEIHFFDETGRRPVKVDYSDGDGNSVRGVVGMFVGGASPNFTFSGRVLSKNIHIVKFQEVGVYKLQVYRFYFRREFMWSSPNRVEVGQPQMITLRVDGRAEDHNFEGVLVGWVLHLNSGSIPRIDQRGPWLDIQRR